jgi:hypothetical protein
MKWKRELKAFYHSVKECKRRQLSAADELKSTNVDEDKALQEDMKTFREEFKATFKGFKDAPRQPSVILSPDNRTLGEPLTQFPQFLGHPRSANFTGRSEQMKALESKLEVEKQALERKFRAVVVHGLGGVGKTQLTNEFAHKHRAKYDACYWIPADTPIKLAQGFENIAQRLQIEETDHAQVRASVIDWLCKTGKRRKRYNCVRSKY